MITLDINGCPVGLRHVTFSDGADKYNLEGVIPAKPEHARIFVKSNDVNRVIFSVAQVVDLVRTLNPRITIQLVMPYLPYARQDRAMVKHESFSLKTFASLLNSLNLDTVLILDAHSDVGPALINNCINIGQEQILGLAMVNRCINRNVVLVAPDAGASKKIHKVSEKLLHKDVVTLDKVRDVTNGAITSMNLFDANASVLNSTCLLVDDLCDGGRTFVMAATELYKAGAKDVQLWVTHGIFSAGIGVLLEGGISHIFTTDSFFTPSVGTEDAVTCFRTDAIIKSFSGY